MAGLRLSVNAGELTLSAGATKTVLQIQAPANQRLLILGYSLGGRQPAGGTDVPVRMRITLSSSGNYGTSGTTLAPGKDNPSNGETVQSVCKSGFSVEPTVASVARYRELTPQQPWTEMFAFGRYIEVPGGYSVQLELTTSAGMTPTVAPEFIYEE